MDRRPHRTNHLVSLVAIVVFLSLVTFSVGQAQDSPTTEVPLSTSTEIPTLPPSEVPTQSPGDTLVAPTETPPPTPSETPTDTATEVPTTAPTETLPPTPSETPSDTATEAPTTTTTEATAEATSGTGLSETPVDTPVETATDTPTPEPTEAPLALLFNENFDAALTGPWILPEGWSQVASESGQALQASDGAPPLEFTAYTLLDSVVQARFLWNAGVVQLSLRQSSVGNYTATLGSDGAVTLVRAGVMVMSASVPETTPGSWRTLRLSAIGASVRVTVDDVEAIQFEDTALLPPGDILISGDGLNGTTLLVDDFAIWVPADASELTTTPTVTMTPSETLTATASAETTEEPQVNALIACSPTGLVQVASESSAGVLGNGNAWDGVVSGDGRYVAFVSEANNLVSGDTNGLRDAFVFDRQTCTIQRISVSSSDTQANGDSSAVAISYDGHYVAFSSWASNLVSGDTNGWSDIFVRDRSLNTTTRVSVASNGSQGNNWSYAVSISSDGGHVAFSSSATNLVSGDTNNVSDVFIHDLGNGQTTRVSVSSSGVQGNDLSDYPSISGDGSFVAFYSAATNLVAGDTNHCEIDGNPNTVDTCEDIFVYDRQTGQTTFASVSSAGVLSNGRSFEPSISYDGRYVAFESYSNNLVPNDTNGAGDIFVLDRETGQTIRASVSSSGVQANGTSVQPSISTNGRYVVFTSYSTNLVPNDTNGQPDLFMYNLWTKQTVRVSQTFDGGEGNGQTIGYSLSNGDDQRAVSDDGQFVVFGSRASNLLSGDTNGMRDFFARRAAPEMPSNLTVTGTSGDSISLSWQDNSSSEQGFTIYRWGYQNGLWDFYPWANVGANTTAFTDTNLYCEGDYYYMVAAYSSTGESMPENWVIGTTTFCPPSNDLFAGAIIVSGLPATFQQDINASTTSNTDPSMSCIFDNNGWYYSNTVWYQYISPTNQIIHINTEGSPNDTVVGVYTGTEGNLTEVACQDDADGPGSFSRVIFNATAGMTYRIMVANWGPNPVAISTVITISFQTLIPPSAPTLIAPTNGLMTNSTAVDLSWNPVANVTGYEIQVDDNANFSSPLVDDQTNALTYSLSGLLDNAYSWRVRDFGDYGVASAWSSVRTFTVDTVAPAPPVLSAPADGATVTTARPTFTWGGVTGANTYRIQIGTDPGFGSVVIDAQTASASYTATTSLLSGTYYWQVSAGDAAGNTGNWSGSRSFMVNLLVAPANNQTTTNKTPMFQWHMVTGASAYEVQVAADALFGNILLSQTTLNGSTTTYTPVSPFAYGTYYWRVNVNMGSWQISPMVWAFTVIPGTPAVPTLNAPVNAAVTNDTTPDFSWNTVVDGDTYEIQIDDSSGFGSPNADVTQSGTNYTLLSPLLDGLFYWRVRAINFLSVAGGWSAARSFTVDTVPPSAAPTLMAPATNAILNSAQVTYTWTSVSTATQYRLQVAANALFTNPAIDVLTASTSQIGASLGQGLYYWHVQARDAAGNWTAWNAISTFTINFMRSPVNNAVIIAAAGARPTFQWYSVVGASGYQIDIATDTGFNGIVYSSPVLSAAYNSFTIPGTDPALTYQSYYWRLTPVGMPSVSNVYWSFAVTPPLPSAPILSAPASATLTNDNTPELDWLVVTYSYGALVYEVQVDNTANFTSPEFPMSGLSSPTVTTAALPDGSYSWRVRAVNQWSSASAWSAVRTLTIDTTAPGVPSLTAPLNNAVLTTVRPAFSWGAVATANRYRIQIATDSGFTNIIPLTVNESATTSLALTQSLGQGDYYWQAQARDTAGNWSNWSAPRHFTINLLKSPTNNMALISTGNVRPTFQWYAATGATGYQVDVATDNQFLNIVYSSPVLGAAAISYTVPAANPGLSYDTYYWRLTPMGLPGVSNVYWLFTATPPLPVAPTLSAPAAGVVTNNITPTLSWLPVTYSYGTLLYEAQVDNTANFTSPEFTRSGLGSPSVTTAPLPDGVYSWRVRAVNQWNSAGVWSLVRTLTIDTTAPSVPSLTAPLNNAVLTTVRPVFSWGLVATANRYRIQIATDSGFTNIIPLTVSDSAATSLALTQSLGQGDYYWQAQARDAAGNWSNWSAPRHFTVNLLKSPAAMGLVVAPVTGARPAFQWYAAAGATGYQLDIAVDSLFSGIVYTSPVLSAAVTSFTLPLAADALPYDTYYWRVRPMGLPSVSNVFRSFTVTPPLPTVPTLTAPANAALINDNTPELDWLPVSYAYGNISYDIQVDNNSTFASPEFSLYSFGSAFISTNPLADGAYSWRVRAVNDWGGFSAWSAVRTFTLDTAAPGVPSPTAPLNNALLTIVRPIYNWGAVATANRYRIQIATDSGFTNVIPLAVNESGTPSLALTQSLGQGDYYWQVSARDAAGNWGNWSAPRHFTINLLKLPTNNTTLVSAVNVRPTFQWYGATGATGYQVDVATDDQFLNIVYSSPVLAATAISHTIPTANPGLTYGTYYWRLVVGGQPAATPIYWTLVIIPPLPTAPVLVLPLTGSSTNNDLVDLSWNAVSYPYGSLAYEVQVDNNNGFTSPEFSLNGLGSTSITTTALADGIYWWRVRAVNLSGGMSPWSTVSIFTVDTQPPSVPSLTLPADNSTVLTSFPTFSWGSISDAVRYEIQVDTVNPPARTYRVTSASFTPFSPLLVGGAVYWRVRAFDAAGNVSNWSAVYTVNIRSSDIAAPLLNSFTGSPVPLTWMPITWATRYEVQIDDHSDFSNVIYGDNSLTSASVTTPTLAPGTYYWRVRARNASGVWSAWSTIGSFTVES
jgi:fibronectin type III domain protein/WD40 repeat protein